MSDLRNIAAFVPVSDVVWGGVGPLGFVSWAGDTPSATFVLRTVSSLFEGNLLPGEALVSGAAPSAIGTGAFTAIDLAPFRFGTDISVIGSVHGGEPNGRGQATLTVGDTRHDLVLLFDANGRCTLDGDVLGAQGERLHLAPRDLAGPEHDDMSLLGAIDPFRRTALTAERLEGGATLSLQGFGRDSIFRTIGFEPRLVLAYASDAVEVPMRVDEIAIDLDAGTVTVRWVAVLDWPLRAGRLERAEVFVLPLAGREKGAAMALRGEVARSTFTRLVRIEDAVRQTAVPALTDDEEAFERLSAFADLGANATLDPTTIARVAAELAHGGESRTAILDRAGLDEVTWAFEERAMAEKLAVASIPDLDGGAPSLVVAYGRAYVDRLGELAPPRDLTVEEFAILKARLESESPPRVLEETGLTVGALQIVCVRMERRIADDRALRGRYETLLGEARVRAGTKEHA